MKRSFDEYIAYLSTKRNTRVSQKFQAALLHFGYPNTSFPSIHIAGTNGKGSVSCKIARGLERTGKKVGLFTSPHIETFCERIQINGRMITEQEILDIAPLLEPFELTFFETAFLIACLYFRENKIDIGVIEAGIGGKHDTTNCLKSVLSVITSIGYDHKEMLGETLGEIAREKAGIIRPGHHLFLGATANYPCMYSTQWTTHLFPPCSDYEQENKVIANGVLQHLNVPRAERWQGIEAGLPCRFERWGDWIFDIAHNPPGIEALLRRLPEKSTFYLGFSRTKDIAECLKQIVPRAHECILLPTESLGLKNPRELIPYLSKYSCPKTMEEAAKLSLTKTPPHVVCGSAYIMAPFQRALSLKSCV